jgi:malate synthase
MTIDTNPLNARIKPAHLERLNAVVAGEAAAPAVRSTSAQEDPPDPSHLAGVAKVVGAVSMHYSPTDGIRRDYFGPRPTWTSPLAAQLQAMAPSQTDHVKRDIGNDGSWVSFPATAAEHASKESRVVTPIGDGWVSFPATAAEHASKESRVTKRDIGNDGSWVSTAENQTPKFADKAPSTPDALLASIRESLLEGAQPERHDAIEAAIAGAAAQFGAVEAMAAKQKESTHTIGVDVANAIADVQGPSFGKPVTRDDLLGASSKLLRETHERTRAAISLVR